MLQTNLKRLRQTKQTRTRLVFFAILAVVLTIVFISLALQILSDGTVVQLFIGCTIFSVGVVALDMLGILGNDDDGSGADHGVDVDAGIDVDAGVDVDTGIDIDTDVDAGVDGVDMDSIDTDGPGYEAGDMHGTHMDATNPLLSIMAYLRLLVYFCLGFGPTGWVGIMSGRSALASLLLAIPVGIVALFLAQAFFRFQRSDTDSSLTRRDLLMSEATVTIPLTHDMMGRVRVQVGMSVMEQYALAQNNEKTFEKGDTVRIVKIDEECVYVD